jgi:SHS2 domain-containing protein
MADTGVEAHADNLPNLIVELATGMFESMASLVAGVPSDGVEIEVEVTGPTPEEVVFAALAELLYESEVGDVFLCDFRAELSGQRDVKVKALGVPFSRVEVTGPPIKAVTYHDLHVEEMSNTWRGRVYFDV